MYYKTEKLALFLTTGKVIKHYVTAEGGSGHTAHPHIKNRMRKAGCHRQVGLGQALQSLQAG